MDRLILFRHGKTEARAPSGEDFDRRLTERGRRDVQRVAQALTEAGFSPDRALASAAVRARETWEAAAASFPEATVETRPSSTTSTRAPCSPPARRRSATPWPWWRTIRACRSWPSRWPVAPMRQRTKRG